VDRGEEERVVGVEQWAEIRRMHRVERLSIRAVHRRTGLHRDTIRRALAGNEPPRYRRPPGPSKLDPLKPWIEEQLRSDPSIPSKRLLQLAEELGYRGGKTIYDDYVREVRPRYRRRRTYQRTLYRPGELVQFDLFEPRAPIPVGHGQLRRGYLVTAELCWSRALAAALVFSKQFPDLAFGMSRCLGCLGALPEKLVWDREGAIHAGGGRPSEELVAFCGQLALGWVIIDPGDAEAKGLLERSHRFMRTSFAPGRSFANELDSRRSSTSGQSGPTPAPIARRAPCRPSDSSRSAGDGRPTDVYAGFCGQLRVDWHLCELADPEAKGLVERLRLPREELRARAAVCESARLRAPARRLVREGQRAHAQDAARPPDRPPRRGAPADAAATRARTRRRPALGDQGGGGPLPALRHLRLLARPPPVGRRVEVRASQHEITAVCLDTGELCARHQRSFAKSRTITALEHARALRERCGEPEAELQVEERPLAVYDALIA
jgi:hypothetical protein